MTKLRFILGAVLLAGALTAAYAAEDEARLLRFPTVGGDKIVFCYAGDLYSVDINGGAAVRLTSHPGYESFPKISPDGKTVAFTGHYDGSTEVYTIPIEGGEPKRITYTGNVNRDSVGERMGPDNIVMGWTPDGSQIIFRSKQQCFSGLRARLALVDANGGLPVYLPTTEGGFCSFSPDGSKLAMNRMFREFRTWKHYRGGQADEIWINTVGTTELTKITDNDAQDIFPMWVGDNIYYLSDRDWTMNLFVYNTVSGQTSKVTDFDEYDCKFPAASNDWIVFENGGYIYKYDVHNGGEATKVDITLNSDGIWGRSEYRTLSPSFGGYSVSPNGKRVLAEVRGDIFSIPAQNGPVLNLTRSPQSHEREPEWSPDGTQIAWISDASGEYQIYLAPADELSSGKALTSFDHGYPQDLQWNPDGSKLYFRTDEREVYELDPVTGKLDCILKSELGGFSGINFSPDGSWMTYTTMLDNNTSAVWLYDVAGRESYQLTDRWYDARTPIFSRDGKYLFFTSARQFTPHYSSLEWDAVFDLGSYAFVVPLAAGTPDPTVLKSDEQTAEPADKEEDKDDKGGKPGKDGKPEKSGEDKAVRTTVDIEGISQRISVLPIDPGHIRLIIAKDDKLYYNARGPMKVLDLKTMKVSDGPDCQYVAFNADASKVLVRAGRQELKVVNFGTPPASAPALPTDEIAMTVDHKKEWKQIFDESWRITRDGFYVENMHGADWDHIYEKYACMLPYVNHRDDLSYLIGEMVGELNVGHAYITSGETPEVKNTAVGLLGGEYSKDAATGAFRIDRILRGVDWDESLRCPLLDSGVDAKVGEYIVAVNGIPASELTAPGEALVGKVGKTVSITLASDANGKDARTVYVKPVADESQLAYYDWVQRNIEIVNELSDGQIGYIHIPDMGPEGLESFARMYYSQLDKKALIVDDRMNGGGNVSPMILERLRREVYRMSMYRNRVGQPVPNQAFYGPMVCLIDKYSSSDGDLFPYGFRQLGLGKLVGMRSWGGIVGISGSKPFVDGQDMRTPFFTSYSLDGEWIIEGYGVDPDVEVDINPFEDFLGNDAQLKKAVEILLEEMKEYKPLPGIPDAPTKAARPQK